jgi:hypothetical protein
MKCYQSRCAFGRFLVGIQTGLPTSLCRIRSPRSDYYGEVYPLGYNAV